MAAGTMAMARVIRRRSQGRRFEGNQQGLALDLGLVGCRSLQIQHHPASFAGLNHIDSLIGTANWNYIPNSKNVTYYTFSVSDGIEIMKTGR